MTSDLLENQRRRTLFSTYAPDARNRPKWSDKNGNPRMIRPFSPQWQLQIVDGLTDPEGWYIPCVFSVIGVFKKLIMSETTLTSFV